MITYSDCQPNCNSYGFANILILI